MRWRWTAVLAMAMALVSAVVWTWPNAEAEADEIDYGATMTVLAEGRTPDPAVQEAWEGYFSQIGVDAAAAADWPAALTYEGFDVDYDLDRETQTLGMVSAEYELESPDNNSYASAVIAVQPSEDEARNAFGDLKKESPGSLWTLSETHQIGDESACLLRQEGDAVEAICVARVQDTLVSALWSSDDETLEEAEQQSALLVRLLVEALVSIERPAR